MMDVLIVTAPKDFNKLPFVCESIISQHPDIPLQFFFVSPSSIPEQFRKVKGEYLLDRDVIDLDFSLINMKNRRGWYRQQFIKLFQKVTSDHYIVIDSDVWLNKPIIEEKYPTFFMGKDQYHKPYFDLMRDIVNVGREHGHSFISEIMMFDRTIIQEMLDRIHTDEQGFFDTCVEYINIVNNASGFSEYELYGNYVVKYHPGKYWFKHINVFSKALLREWTTDELHIHISSLKKSNYDLLTMHSWL
jgi:hypothetical protein